VEISRQSEAFGAEERQFPAGESLSAVQAIGGENKFLESADNVPEHTFQMEGFLIISQKSLNE